MKVPVQLFEYKALANSQVESELPVKEQEDKSSNIDQLMEKE